MSSIACPLVIGLCLCGAAGCAKGLTACSQSAHITCKPPRFVRVRVLSLPVQPGVISRRSSGSSDRSRSATGDRSCRWAAPSNPSTQPLEPARVDQSGSTQSPDPAPSRSVAALRPFDPPRPRRVHPPACAAGTWTRRTDVAAGAGVVWLAGERVGGQPASGATGAPLGSGMLKACGCQLEVNGVHPQSGPESYIQSSP